MSLVKTIYRLVIPESIRWKVIEAKKQRHYNNIKSRVLDYYQVNPSKDAEINNALKFLKSNELSVFPYPFFLNYKHKQIDVFKDDQSGLPYVMHHGKKLFFKRSWKDSHIIDAYRFLLAEQDRHSGHCYLTDTYKLDDDSVVVDVGAAEGIFCLHKIEQIKHIYLIETDTEWIEALEETFKPWKEKITIINKFISDKDSDQFMKLDSYFKEITIDFLKIDVDGAEEELIRGAEFVISNKVKKLAICTYHKNHDYDDFSKYLTQKNYSIHHSDGYMLFYFDEHFQPPYFRRGLIRAVKNA